MARLYEGMFLLDNQLVREDWKKAKGLVTDFISKHGGKTITSRRWDERKLCYPIKKRNRATYLMTYFEIETDSIPTLARDLELNEPILRHMFLQVQEVPEQEHELAKAEEATDFTVPAPPPDDHVEEPPPEEYDRRDRRDHRDRDRRGPRDGDKPAAAEGDKPAEADAEKAKTETKTEPVAAEAPKEG